MPNVRKLDSFQSPYAELDVYYDAMVEKGMHPTIGDPVIDAYINRSGITAYYDYMDYRSNKSTKVTLEEFQKLAEIEFPARKIKPKANYKSDKGKFNAMDFCNTPEYALDPLYPFLPVTTQLWESAMGKGNLYYALVAKDYNVIGSDIRDGIDFFKWKPPEEQFIQVTNPPYGGRLKEQWTRRSYELGMPFALLMPVEFLGTQGLHKLWRQYGQTQQIFFTQRINFDMPIKGLEGPDGWKSSAQFSTCWYCWNLNLPRDNMVYDLKKGEWWS